MLTTSAVMSFSQELEKRMAAFYHELELNFPQHSILLHDFVLSCAKTQVQLARAYQEAVSDALETGFAFQDISLEAYPLDMPTPEYLTWQQALASARTLEEAAQTLYADLARRSESLLGSIQRAFTRAARAHGQRRETLERLSLV
jgi:hypothetical protein